MYRLIIPEGGIRMSQETKKRIHTIYGICLSAVTVVAGICFMAACCYIYYTGMANDLPQVYTRPIVAEAFGKIAIPVYLCLAFVVGGFILHMALPMPKKKLSVEKNLPLILERLQAKTDLSNCDATLVDGIVAQQKQRRMLCIISAALLSVGSVFFLIHACNPANWGNNSTPNMVTAMYMMIGCLTAPLAFTIYTAYMNRKSLQAEIELMKQANAQSPKNAEKAAVKTPRRFVITGIQAGILVIGLVLLVLGVFNQGTADILNKAVAICTECVGLG